MKKQTQKQKQANNRRSQKRLILKVKRREHNKRLKLSQQRLEKQYRQAIKRQAETISL